MNETPVQITPPAAEPVAIDEFKVFMGVEPEDVGRDVLFTNMLKAAREECERYTRIRLITQTWLLRMDSFPGVSVVYDRNGFPTVHLPFPPFQSIQFVKYIDTAGVLQTMPRDISYGTDSTVPFYCYQMEPGGGIKPARLTAMWARPLPPQRLVLSSTMIQFRCGFGGPLTVSIANGSKVLTVPGFKFNPDDAPQIAGDTGTKIRITNGAAVDKDLVTHVASVDSNGVATLTDAAGVDVTSGAAWLGHEVPEALRLSIMFHAQFMCEQGAVIDQAIPRIVNSLRDSYRNFVS